MDQHVAALTRLMIPLPDAAALAPELRPRAYAAGEIVFDCLRTDAEALILTAGRAAVLCVEKGGVEVATLAAPGFVGSALVLPGWLPGYVVVAETRVEGLGCPAAALRTAVEGSPAVRAALLAQCGRLFGDVLARAACHAVHGTEARLASWLIVAHQACRGSIGLTHDVIAKRLGVRRATVTTALHLLEAEGAIWARRSRIDIRNPDRLLRRSCGCHGYAASDIHDPDEPTPAELALAAPLARLHRPLTRPAFR